MTYVAYHSADLIIADGSDTGVYGDGCEPGDGARMEHGWVNPSWSRWAVYDDRDHVAPSKYEPELDWCELDIEDCGCEDFRVCPNKPGPVIWLANLINESLPGGVELCGGELTGWTSSLYSADSERNREWKTEATRCLHPKGFTDEEVLQAVAWSTYMPQCGR